MRTVELFCGAGGLSLGLHRAGCEVIRALDIWPEAVAVYRANLRPAAELADLSDLMAVAPAMAALRPDLIAGGPPCQDFSAAGHRVEVERASLMIAFAMVVGVARPRWLLLENVRRTKDSVAWATARELLIRAGYGLTETVVDAARYGVGQSRRRLIVVGRLGEADGFLASAIRGAASARSTTIRDVLDGGSAEADMALLRAGALYVRPFGGGRGVRSVDEPCPAIVRTSAEPLGPRYLSAPHPGDLLPVAEVRWLTREQASRLQGFPADWDWSPVRRLRDVDQMIANAVPAPLAEAIGRAILARDRGESVPTVEPGFSEWLRGCGVVGQVLRNRRAQLGRARRLLGGRIIADLSAELAALEAARGFAALSKGVRSDLRAALRLHAEWRALPPKSSKGRRADAPEPVGEMATRTAA